MHSFSRARLVAVFVACSAALAAGVGVDDAVAAPVAGLQPGDGRVQAERDRERIARGDEETAAERARRSASRRAFAGLSRLAALDVLKEWHPEHVLLPAWRAPRLPLGFGIEEYKDDFAAVVASPDGSERQIVTSTVPMRARGEDGEKQPVDLALEETADAYRPINPLADVQLSKRAADGLGVPGLGLTVRPEGAAGHLDPVLSGDTVFYAEAETDTDLLVQPTIGGFALSLQLRSEDSPEHFALDLEVTDGIRLERTPTGIELWRDDALLGAVTAPVAWDSDRRPVELAWDLVDGRLTIDVPHRDQDLAYPLLVDPEAVTYFNWERRTPDDAMRYQYGAWKYIADGNFAGLSWAGDSTWLGNGLYIRNLAWGTTGLPFTAGQSGMWTSRVPGFSRISQVEWNLVDQDYVDRTRLELGVTRHPLDDSAGGWYGKPVQRSDVFYNGYFRTCTSTCAAGTGQPGDEAIFKVLATSTGNIPYFAAQVGVAYVYLSEDDEPQVASGLPTGWVNWPTTKKLDLWAFDASTGVDTLEATANGWAGGKIWQDYGRRCNHHARCPNLQTADGATYSIAVGNMPEGINTLTLTGRDSAANTPGTPSRDPGYGAGLRGLRGTYFNNNNFTGRVLSRRDEKVDFDWALGAPDPALSPDTFSVRWIGYVEPTVTGDYAFSTRSDDGVRLFVEGSQPSSTDRIDANTPLIYKWKNQAPTDYAGATTRRLVAGERYRIVLEYFEATGGAMVQLKWTPPGQATPTVIPTDRMTPPQPYELRLDRGRPTFDTPSGTLWNRREQPVDQASSVSMTARDGVPLGASTARRSGVSRIEAWLTNPAGVALEQSEKTQGQTCTVKDGAGNDVPSPDSCPLTHSYTFDPADSTKPPGWYTIEFRAFDHAGNPARTQSWRFLKRDATDPVLGVPTENPPPQEPPGWVDERTATITVAASDVGLGVHSVELTEPLEGGDTVRTPPNFFNSPGTTQQCEGTLAKPCPPGGTQDFLYTTAEYREGYVEPSLVAVDAGLRRSASRKLAPPLKIDHTGPAIGFSDALAPYENKAITAAGSYKLHIAVTDGVQGGTPAQQRSGVDTVEVQVQKDEGTFQRVEFRDNDCLDLDSCSDSTDYTVATSSFGDGLHAIRVIAYDRLGHRSERTLRFFIDLLPPVIDAISHSESIDHWFNARSLTVSATARDDGTGIAKFLLTEPRSSGDVDTAHPRDCAVPPDPSRRCPQQFDGPAATYSTGVLREGAAVPLSLRAVDAVNRSSAAKTWTLKIDHGPPSAVSDFSADYDPDIVQADVSWEPATDPALADGSPGSGVASYRVRWSGANGQWTAWQTVTYPGLSVPNSHNGDKINVEVRAVDAAGTEGPLASAQVVAQTPATWSCAEQPEGAYPSTCIAGYDPPSDIDESADAPRVSLVPLDGTARSSEAISGRYEIKVRNRLNEPYASPFDRWTTIRSSGGSWVIGQAHDGDLLDAERRNTAVPTGGSGGFQTWYFGKIDDFTGGPGGNGCGWVWAGNTAPVNVNNFAKCGSAVMDIVRFSSRSNCPGYQDSGGHRCDHGTRMLLTAATRICANIGLRHDGISTGCHLGGANHKGNLEKGDCVEWRYITRDPDRERQYVMVKLRNHPNPEASWIFIRRTALPRNSRLKTITSPNWDQSCPRT